MTHRIVIEPISDHVEIFWRDHKVVDTRHAVELKEATYPPVIYAPREDADMNWFTRSTPRALIAPSKARPTISTSSTAPIATRTRSGPTRPRRRASRPSSDASPSIPAKSSSADSGLNSTIFKRQLVIAKQSRATLHKIILTGLANWRCMCLRDIVTILWPSTRPRHRLGAGIEPYSRLFGAGFFVDRGFERALRKCPHQVSAFAPISKGGLMANEEFKAARDFLLSLRDNYAFARASFRWPRPKRFNWALDWFDDELARRRQRRQAGAHHPRRRRSKPTPSPSSRKPPTASPTACRRLGAKRGDRLHPDARQCRAALDCDARGDEARPRRHPRHHAARRRRHRRPPAARAREVRHRRRRRRAEIRGRRRRRRRASRSARRHQAGAASTSLLKARATLHARARRPTPTIRCCSISPPAPRRGRSSCCTATRAIRSAISRRCTACGLKPGDRHLNISSPGWAKHAWSNFFAPWNAGATRRRAQPPLRRARPRSTISSSTTITSFCAPPTVWRQLIQLDLSQWKVNLREVNSAGEPLNPEVIEQVARAWGLTFRDSYGQTETTMMVGNPVGERVDPRLDGPSAARLPHRARRSSTGSRADHGEIAIPLNARPVGLMLGYQDDDGNIEPVRRRAAIAPATSRRATPTGFITYVGRADDVFKSSDYRLSPFELESALIEHPAVAEAAVVPAPDPARLNVAKAYVTLAAGAARRPRHRARDLRLPQRPPRALQARPPPRIPRAAEDDLRKNPPRRTAPARDPARQGRRTGRRRIPARGFSGARVRRHRVCRSFPIISRGTAASTPPLAGNDVGLEATLLVGRMSVDGALSVRQEPVDRSDRPHPGPSPVQTGHMGNAVMGRARSQTAPN